MLGLAQMGSLKAIVKRVVKGKDPTSTSFRQVSGFCSLYCNMRSIIYLTYGLAAGGMKSLDIRIYPIRDHHALKHFV